MTDQPYAIGCPECPYAVETLLSDPDATLDAMFDHLQQQHTAWNRARSFALLARVRPLTAGDVAP